MKSYRGQKWRERAHAYANRLALNDCSKSANLLYRQVIADAIAESKAMQGTDGASKVGFDGDTRQA